MDEISTTMKFFIVGQGIFFALFFGSRIYRFFKLRRREKQWDREELIEQFGENYQNNPEYLEYKALMKKVGIKVQ